MLPRRKQMPCAETWPGCCDTFLEFRLARLRQGGETSRKRWLAGQSRRRHKPVLKKRGGGGKGGGGRAGLVALPAVGKKHITFISSCRSGGPCSAGRLRRPGGDSSQAPAAAAAAAGPSTKPAPHRAAAAADESEPLPGSWRCRLRSWAIGASRAAGVSVLRPCCVSAPFSLPIPTRPGFLRQVLIPEARSATPTDVVALRALKVGSA